MLQRNVQGQVSALNLRVAKEIADRTRLYAVSEHKSLNLVVEELLEKHVPRLKVVPDTKRG